MNRQIDTKRQKSKITHEGHLYTFDKASADGMTKFWRCEFKDLCKGRIWTNLADQFIRLATPHTCPANASSVEVQKVKTAIKRRALATYEPPAVIRSEALQNVPSPAGLFVTQNSSRQIVKRARHEVNAPPVVPKSVDQLIVPPAYRTYKPIEGDEEQFLLGDSGVYYEAGNENPQRILLFGRASFGRWADRMKECFGDGTFSLAPPMFYQIYTILARRGAWVIVVCHCLLTSKSQASYERMYELLKQAWPTFSPSSFTIDFETAARNATVNAFPGCAINFCFFHFVRNLQKKIKERSLWQRYCTDTVFAETVKMLTSVAFLPLSDIRTAVIALDTELGNDVALRPLIDWLLNNYIGQPRPNGTWSQPTFPPEQWNVYTRTLNGEARTNNHAEAEHHRLQGAFNCRHPSIWHFIDVLRREQKGTDGKYASFVAGLEPPQKAPKYQAADKRLFNLVQNYIPVNPNNDNDHNYHINPNHHIILEFLRGISRNYHMNPWICGDVWMDILPSFNRRQLGLKMALLSPRFDALVDTHFYGKNELTIWRSIKICKNSSGPKPKVSVRIDGNFVGFPLPDHPLPNKIRFMDLNIVYIDHSVLAFLHANKHIWDKCGTNLFVQIGSLSTIDTAPIWQAFAHKIWPIFTTTIRRFIIRDGNHMNNLLRLISPTILTDHDDHLKSIDSVVLLFPDLIADQGPNATSAGQALAKWLHTPRKDGQPKRLRYCEELETSKLEWLIHEELATSNVVWVNHFKETFLRATVSVSYTVQFVECAASTQLVPFELVNERTNEKLTLMMEEKTHWLLKRCPIIIIVGETAAAIKWENDDKNSDANLNNVQFNFWGDRNCIGPLSPPAEEEADKSNENVVSDCAK
ncbi:hypothetical protein niasHT_019338 [Heterodera trifolii]|uniref:MULE transposase domain-containing protein n=1 Tax=Heterodera trifolii TaxID=157864 RepID=A0ABD2L5H5_9BILA